ncbi:DNA/RNA helicase domain-containing protein, partial [Chloroflexota bacterium]
IQNIHHFRDDAMASDAAPVERVAIFDEAQRAWDLKQTASFMKSRKGIPGFSMSEPEFLISVMDRHNGWATIICLIGGGQEINTGEAGLSEWFRVLGTSYSQWSVFISGNLVDSEYTDVLTQEVLQNVHNLERREDLHLATSIRSFRSESVSDFVKALLDCAQDRAKELLKQIDQAFPIWITRDLPLAKAWLHRTARGTERYGIIASSEAQRLKPFGINVKAEIDPKNWFLNGKTDIRSSFYLEDVATEFQIQGLELDWTCVAWDGDLRFSRDGWEYYCFRGTRWQTIKNEENRRYLKNAYRVLLTRARQGMVIFLPEGSSVDHTRRQEFYDHTYTYLRNIGIPELTTQHSHAPGALPHAGDA